LKEVKWQRVPLNRVAEEDSTTAADKGGTP